MTFRNSVFFICICILFLVQLASFLQLLWAMRSLKSWRSMNKERLTICSPSTWVSVARLLNLINCCSIFCNFFLFLILGYRNSALIDNLIFCLRSQVKAEILKVEKSDEPVHKLILDLVSRLTITKLVMGLSFMKPSAGYARSLIRLTN